MHIVLLGSPGAGKGTQAKFITEHYHIPVISTGDILRQAIEQESVLGKQVKAIVASGNLVPDETVIALVKARIHEPDCAQGFLLDGFPRTVAQAEALEAMTTIDCVIDLDVSAEAVVKRLSGRRIHPASGRIYHIVTHPPKVDNQDDLTGEPLIQRPDDEEKTIRDRLAVYQTQTAPLRAHYQQQAAQNDALDYFKIDGTKSVAETTQTIFAFLDQRFL